MPGDRVTRLPFGRHHRGAAYGRVPPLVDDALSPVGIAALGPRLGTDSRVLQWCQTPHALQENPHSGRNLTNQARLD